MRCNNMELAPLGPAPDQVFDSRDYALRYFSVKYGTKKYYN